MKNFLLSIVIFLIVTFANAKDYLLNDFAVKFEDETELEIEIEEYVQFGLPSVDALNEYYGVINTEKIFKSQNGNRYAMWYVFYLSENHTDILDIIADYQNDPNIEIAEADYLVEFTEDEFIPNDEMFDLESHPDPDPYTHITMDQWALRNDGNIGTQYNAPINAISNADMQATEFWYAINPNNIIPNQKIIAIDDTGLDWQHPDWYETTTSNNTSNSNIWQNLGEDADGDGHTIEWIGNEWVFDPGDSNGIDDDDWDNDPNTFIDDFIGWNFISDNNNPFPGGHTHGTEVASGAGARTNNNIGMAGSAFYCKIMPVCALSTSRHSMAIDYAFVNNVDIINFSWTTTGMSVAFREAVQRAYSQNKLLVGGAGNWNSPFSWLPASMDEVISAGGIFSDYKRYGNYNREVELLAPADNVVAMQYDDELTPKHNYVRSGGTSLASPLISGSIAGIWSQFPSEDNITIRQRMSVSAFNVETYNSPIYAGKSGNGLVNMLDAYLAQSFLSFKVEDIIVDDINDDRLSPGETVDLRVDIKNMGEDVTGVHSTISSNDPYISISLGNSDYDDLDFLAIGQSLTNFEISAVGFPPMGHTAEINMIINTNQGNFQLTFPILIQDNQHVNFPALSNKVEFVKACDIDGDGREDIITYSNYFIYLFRYNQHPISIEISSDPYYIENVFCSIGNVDKSDNFNEIILQYNEVNPDPIAKATKIAVIQYSQNSLNLKFTKVVNSVSSFIPPLAFDLNNDESDEILFSQQNKLILYRYNSSNNNLEEVWNKELIENRLPTIADINQDGKNEIIVSYGNTIDILDASGNQLLSNSTIVCDGISTPTIADVNNDGFLDVVCFSTHSNSNQVWVLNGQDLTEISSSDTGLFSSNAKYSNPVLVYNLDNDPELEILFHHEDNLLLYNDFNMAAYTGMKSGLPSSSFPFIAEIQDYTYPLIFHCEAHGSTPSQSGVSGRYLMGWKNDGSFAFDNGQNNILATYVNSEKVYSAILDFDGDDNYDIVVGTGNELLNFNGNQELKKSKIEWNQENKNVSNNKLFAQTFNSSFEPADGVNTIVWNYGYETPVILSETVTIPQGVKLIISPGSRIFFQPGAKLEINGKLTAEGTETDSIYFSSFSDVPGQRGLGLVFSDPELPSTNYLQLSHCSFKNLSIGAKVDMQWSALTEIRNSFFSNCNVGISLNYAHSPLVENCVIKNNIIGLEINSSSPEIRANTITNNSRYGIIFVTSSGDVAGNSKSDYQLISDNGFSTADPPGGGIYCFNGSAPVFEKTEKDGDYGYNQIIDNDHYGVKAEMESPVILGHDYGFNSIHSNSEYQVRAYEESEVTANQIWWGTSEPSSELFDWDASSGIDFSDYLESDPFEGKISKNSIKSTNTNTKESFVTLTQQKVQKIIEEGTNKPNLPVEGIISTFRNYYVKKDLNQLKTYILQNIRNTTITRTDITNVMAYLSNLFIQERDTSFIPFIVQFTRIKNDSVLFRQYSNLKPAHLLMAGKVDDAYRLCNTNLTAFKDTLTQTNNLYTQFRIQLYNKKNLDEAEKIYDALFSTYPKSDMTVLAEIDLASQQGLIPNLNKRSGSNIVIDKSEIPKVFALSQNYPNPFNPVTKIKYQLPKVSKVKLEIFNILGQKVRTLINEQKEAAYYQLKWDGLNDWGRQSSTGIYFYRLTAEAIDGNKKYVKNKKMLLIR